MSLIVAGIDPGIIDTGLVVLQFQKRGGSAMQLDVYPRRIPGVNVGSLKEVDITGIQVELGNIFLNLGIDDKDRVRIFVEKYRTRSNLRYDARLIAAVAELKKVVHAKPIDNMGMTKIITDNMLILLDLWTFGIPTHHQDIRAAARIALLGMAKDEGLNTNWLYPAVDAGILTELTVVKH